MSAEPATWRDLRAELNADQIAELEGLESGTALTDDHLLNIARMGAAWNLDDAMVDVLPPPAALSVGHWTTFGGEKTREYLIAERRVGDTGDTSAELCGEQHLDGSTKRRWITVGGNDLTVEQARGLATALHELAAMLESAGGDA